ncbi:MAG: hydrolase TatD [Thermodesulfatator sp.]|nr:MAG: hydrolase TatD [Thermodesulfatator sp.]
MNEVFIVDTHAHLDMINDGTETGLILETARESGVGAVISVGIDLESSKKATDFSKRYQGVYAAVGIHPNDASDFTESNIKSLLSLAAKERTVAWGEIGLDYYRKHTSVSRQRAVFEAQLEVAASLAMPVIIHDRDAHDDCLAILRSFLKTSELGGVFHCFSGDISIARRVLDLGFFLSFTGVITFPRAKEAVEVVAFAPADRIMVETDSPFLSPVPFRGKTNEPARARVVAEKMAEIRGTSLEEMAKCTTRNAKDLFGL